jgi:protein deglycase
MKKIAVLLAEGFEEVEAVTPIDFLRRAGIEVVTAGVTGENVKGAHDVTFAADKAVKEVLAAAEEYDGVVVPGGMPGAEHVAASREAGEFIKTMAASGKLIAAICAAPAVVLEPLGVLEGKQATCYPGFEEQLRGAAFKAKRVVVDGNCITSRGPGTAGEFALAIIEYLRGKETAKSVRGAVLLK